MWKEVVELTEEKDDRTALDPAELWMKWYETGANAWSEMLKTNKEMYADPWGLYRQWFESMEEAREQISDAAGSEEAGGNEVTQAMARAMTGGIDPRQAQNWFEETARSWQETVGYGLNAASFAPRWIQMMQEARDNLMKSEGGMPTDPLRFAVQWYNATSGPLAEFVQDMLENEEFLAPSSKFLQNYARFYRIFRQASEEYLGTLQLPTRSDVARVAGLVVALEDKVDRIEEAFEDFQDGYREPATAEEVRSLEGRIDQLGRKLGERPEKEYATAESVSNLERRIDRVESKLDRLIAAVESQASAREEPNGQSGTPQREIKATAAARRKAQEIGLDLAEIDGTGPNGEITINDVRKKGES